MKYIALLLLALLQVVLSIILGHKKRSSVSRLFTFFTALLLVWTVTNIGLDYAVNNTTGFGSMAARLTFLNTTNRLGFFVGTLTLVFLYRLLLIFPVPRQTSKISRLITLAGIAVACLAALTIVSGNYTLAGNAQPVYHYGRVSAIILLYFLLVAAVAIHSIALSLRLPKTSLTRRQAKTVLSGLLLTGIWAIFFIIVLPDLVSGQDKIVFVGYFAPYIFTASLLYSISRQGFLNFRAIVARSIGYALALGLIIVIFLIATLSLIRIFSGNHITLGEAMLFAVFNVLTALAFQPMRRFFDRATNRVFYRDAYDTQELLDRLNRLFVANTNLEQLLRHCATAIGESFKVEFCFFSIVGPSKAPRRIIGYGTHPRLQAEDVAEIRRVAPKMERKVIVTEDIDSNRASLQHVLEANNIAVLGRLSPTADKTAEEMGYIILGPRRSGNPYTRNDLRVIEIIVNELVIAIENSLRFEEIQNFNETLQANVSDATRRLRRTNDKLQALDATKDEFISMASHQLRTPLTSVKGYLSMVLEGDVGKLNAQQKQLLTQSYTSAQRMVYLISDLLNLSRLSTGKFVIESVPTDLGEVVQGEIDQLHETAKSRDVTLHYDRPATFPKLLLDETKIHQVVMNFMDNAIYYTPAGGQVTVALRETATAVELTVHDTGIGVPRAEQHRLFTKFYRAGNARKARPDGTGLGLFMAKKVIAAQGGSIIFESAEGKGSTFGFRFSKAKHALPNQSADRPGVVAVGQ